MMESPVDAQVSHVVMIFLYYLHLHGGWQHHPIPIGQCLVQHSITKMIVGIHPFHKASQWLKDRVSFLQRLDLPRLFKGRA